MISNNIISDKINKTIRWQKWHFWHYEVDFAILAIMKYSRCFLIFFILKCFTQNIFWLVIPVVCMFLCPQQTVRLSGTLLPKAQLLTSSSRKWHRFLLGKQHHMSPDGSSHWLGIIYVNVLLKQGEGEVNIPQNVL